MSNAVYVINPDYGNGCYRRRIKLTRTPGAVLAELEDNCHGFRVALQHDGKVVTAIKAEFLRIPFSTCSSADAPIQALLGAALDSPLHELNRIANPKSNCTHVHDLTILAMHHTLRAEKTVIYDVKVTDARDGISDLRVWRNDALMHHWQSRDNHLLSPDSLKGKPLFSGFNAWSCECFSGLALEAARVLQKGNLVSTARMFDFDKMAGNIAYEESSRHACHTFSPDYAKKAVRLQGTGRDFTHDQSRLLEFT